MKLKGFDELTLKRHAGGAKGSGQRMASKTRVIGSEPKDGTRRIAIAMPVDVDEAAERIDPILLLPGLAGTIEQLETKIAEVVALLPDTRPQLDPDRGSANGD